MRISRQSMTAIHSGIRHRQRLRRPRTCTSTLYPRRGHLQKMSKIDQWFTLIHYVIWLVVWNTWILFPYIGNFIIPTDFNSIIFQRGRAKNHQPAMLWWWWFWVMGIHRRITHGIQWIIWVKLPINGPRKTTGGGRWGRIQFSSSRKIDDHDY